MGATITVSIPCPACGNPDATITTYNAGDRTDVLAVDCAQCTSEVMA